MPKLADSPYRRTLATAAFIYGTLAIAIVLLAALLRWNIPSGG